MLNLELKVPPVIVVAITALLMKITSNNLAEMHWSFSSSLPSIIVFVVLIIFAIAICLAGVMSFRKANTTVNPTAPHSSSTLVCTGIYRYTRNPMYLGFFIFLLAVGWLLQNYVSFLWLFAFVVYMNKFQISPEEKALTQLFGQDFKSYQSQVRRWL